MPSLQDKFWAAALQDGEVIPNRRHTLIKPIYGRLRAREGGSTNSELKDLQADIPDIKDTPQPIQDFIQSIDSLPPPWIKQRLSITSFLKI